MAEFKGILGGFVPHRAQYKMQRTSFSENLGTLGDGEVAFVVDFQERLQIKEQDQVQSQHWAQEATTIFPCPIYFKWGGRVWSYCFTVLSDDMEQDNAWVQYVMTRLMRDDVPALFRKLGAPPMTTAFIWTDNCAKQFKCKYHWGWVGDAGVYVADARGESTAGGKKLHIEHHYFGPKHGKNPSDSAGAQAKSFTTMMVKRTRGGRTSKARRISAPSWRRAWASSFMRLRTKSGLTSSHQGRGAEPKVERSSCS